MTTAAPARSGLANSANSYGAVTRGFHWATAALILVVLPLGWIAHALPAGTEDEIARKGMAFSVHKTLGLTTFLVALLRILWAVGQPRPAPVHPTRRGETLLAETVHWTLYAALVVMPLSGWVIHAATSGFAPILWPFGQSLPFVPKSEAVAGAAGAVHWVFARLFVAALVLHVAGALKHALYDRDAVLSRMLRGHAAPADPAPNRHGPALISAALILAASGAIAAGLATSGPGEGASSGAPAITLAAQEGGNWLVDTGRIGLGVEQFGSRVEGSFADWTARIAFDPDAAPEDMGEVEVQIAIPSLTLGSVTDQALGPDYFAAESFPTAIFDARIERGTEDETYVARGTLTLKGAEIPVALPFTLDIQGDTARMTGQTELDRRDFDIGSGQNEGTLGTMVDVAVDLTATRTQ
ncbi:cytochrome [Mesobaculum littorinae]|uniref:Cytochrome n=1 Tax=Mesobaculum littorinae TaxID=2486419 RepID=A0A438AJW6_9RHOB|nr:cytochrome b/b6 domain-containing protein [Mesobaculum littorinae]RVV98988.1 cytochrome [Mesobaculum littorinae]